MSIHFFTVPSSMQLRRKMSVRKPFIYLTHRLRRSPLPKGEGKDLPLWGRWLAKRGG